MTAYLVDNEVRLVDAFGGDALVVSGSSVSASQGAIILAGVDSQGKVSFSKIVDGTLQVSFAEPTLSEVGLYAENVTGSSYFMALDLNNVSGSYRHDASMLSGIRLTSIQGSIEKTVSQDRWKTQLGVVLETSPTSSVVSWISPGSQALNDTFRFYNSIDYSQKNIVDLTVRSGSLAKLANNYNESLIDLTSFTLLNDVAGRIVSVEPGDLVLRVKRLSDHGGSLSFHYHLWYQTKD
jgi:hypothetical protein